jgi:UDP:flavonoid glycosyltransferase YjiC (YdhE family)
LQIGVPGFEYKRSDLGNNVRFIGALSNASSNKIWNHPKLAQYNKMILVTQGTVEKDISKLIIPTLEAFKNSEYLVVVTTGGSHTEDLRNHFNYPNIIIEDFIPFNEIMPLANVYITNGGYGGVMLGIINKLPMVVAGVHEGKNEINARVGYFKIGVNLHTERPAPAQLKAGVSEVLHNSLYKHNIENLSNEVSQYNSNELCAAYIDEVLKLTSYTKHFNHLKS